MTGRSDSIDLPMFQAAQAYLRSVTQGRPCPKTQCIGAWDTFYSVCDGLIHRFATGFGARNADLDDCSQEAWAELVPLLVGFDYDPSRGDFRTWLYKIVRSATVNFLRRRNQQDKIHKRLNDMSPDRATYDADDELDTAPMLDKAEILRRARKQLTPVNYRLMHMRWVEGRSVSDVASEMGMTHEQVWYHEHRIRKNLRKVFAADNPSYAGRDSFSISETRGRETPHAVRAA